MWKLALSLAIKFGLGDWAKRKGLQLASKLKDKALKKADGILETVGEKVVKPPEGSIVIREDKDTLRPGATVVRDSRSYRVTKLLMVNKLGAFYEAKAE